METPNITWLLVSIVAISAIAGIFGLFIVKASDAYGIAPAGDLQAYDKMEELATATQSIQQEVSSVKEKSGVLDVLGSFFSNAYNIIVKIPSLGIGIVSGFINQAVIDLHLGEGGVILKNAGIVILLILLFIGVILAVLLKTGSI